MLQCEIDLYRRFRHYLMAKELNIWLHHNPYKDKKRAKPHSDAILQQLLQHELNTSETIEIKKNSNGKPYIKQHCFFSHSNSRQLYAYVCSPFFEVSIDVECFDSKRDVMKLAERYYNPKEYNVLKKLPKIEQINKFYQLWTEKEAWCKLEGGNLWGYLNQQPVEKEQLYFSMTTCIKGFAVTVACTEKIDKIRINALGQQQDKNMGQNE